MFEPSSYSSSYSSYDFSVPDQYLDYPIDTSPYDFPTTSLQLVEEPQSFLPCDTQNPLDPNLEVPLFPEMSQGIGLSPVSTGDSPLELSR